MSDQSLEALVQRMQGKSVTLGWDAVVTMNRAKVNQLLEQQYIQNFNMNSFLKRIHALVPLDTNGRIGLDMTGLLLSKPLLSFENASLSASRARLTMNVVSGMIGYKALGALPRITSSYAVTEAHGFSVSMIIDLEAVMGAVDKHGEVVLDLSKAYEFSCDMVTDPLEQGKLGDYFGTLFKRLPASSRVYRLGMLDFDPDDVLAPRNFIVRTQAAPGGRDRNSDTFGEGGVVLLVRTRVSTHDGNNPSEDFPYLIPDDLDAGGKRQFSGSLVLSSKAVFDWFIASSMANSIGRDLRFERVDDSSQTARELVARSGGFAFERIEMEHSSGGSHWSVTSSDPLYFPFGDSAAGSLPLRVSVVDNGELKIVWHTDQTFRFFFTEFHTLIGRKEEDADVRFTLETELRLKPLVDPLTSVVSFEALPGAVRKFSASKINGEIDLYYVFQQAFDSRLSDMMNTMLDAIANTTLPELDLFALNHLLFPEQNALLLTHGALPGDLALFGHIDPRHTSFSVEPTFATLEAGSNHTFEVLSTSLKAGAQAVTWSVTSVDGSRSAGEIDQNGKFTAPPRDRMQGQAVRNVVTARMLDPDTGDELSASSLVVVVGEGTVVMPSMDTIDLSNTKKVQLRASTLSGGGIKWTLVSGPGTLEPDGARATYTPPRTIEQSMGVALIEVEDTTTQGKALSTVLLSKSDYMVKVTPYYHPGLPPKATLRLRVEEEDVPSSDITWTVIAGGGTMNNATGEFTAPDKITIPYSVIQAEIADDVIEVLGYSVIFQSEYAMEAKWFELNTFELEIDSPTPNLYSNGRQQVSVKITVDPQDVDGESFAVTDTELDSIVLVNADTHEPLPVVDEDGVPEGEKIWAYALAENDNFDYYPNHPVAAQDPETSESRFRHLYVQTRADTKLKIAARLTRDDLAMFYSNQEEGGEGEDKIIQPNPMTPPNFHEESFIFEAVRVHGGEEDDYNMDTVDFYILKLRNGPDETLKFKYVEFEERSGMVQWESRQFAEDVASFTGYALYGDTELRFDPPLRKYLTEAGVDMRSGLVESHPCPEGALLISLHRVQYWYFDLMCEGTYARPVILTLLDVFGNKHRLSINFASSIDRHKLVVRPV